MPKLLHLACSPRADSESAAGARVFMESFRKARPDWEIDAMNLWREPLPEFEGYLLEAKYARIGGKTFDYMPPLLIIAAIYLLFVMGLTWLQGRLERRLRQSERR